MRGCIDTAAVSVRDARPLRRSGGIGRARRRSWPARRRVGVRRGAGRATIAIAALALAASACAPEGSRVGGGADSPASVDDTSEASRLEPQDPSEASRLEPQDPSEEASDGLERFHSGCGGGSGGKRPQEAGGGPDGAGAGFLESFGGSFDADTGRFWLSPTWLVPSGSLPSEDLPAVAGHVLEFVDAEGEAVSSVPLRGPVYEDSDRELAWELYVAERPAFSSIRIRRGQQTVVKYSGSASAPEIDEVQVEQTEPSSSTDGDEPSTRGVSWSARDADGGALWRSCLLLQRRRRQLPAGRRDPQGPRHRERLRSGRRVHQEPHGPGASRLRAALGSESTRTRPILARRLGRDLLERDALANS